MTRIVFIIVFTLLLSGCSVSRSIQGTLPPNLEKVRVGVPHSDVYFVLGHENRIKTVASGERLYIYEYEGGRAPSFIRTVSNIFMDLITVCLWEFAPSSHEATKRIHIIYDDNDRVDSIDKYVVAAN